MESTERPPHFDPTHHGTQSGEFRKPRQRYELVGVLTLMNVSGALGPLSFHVRQGELVIGRSNDNQAVVPDASVSRRHATIRRVENEFILHDLESLNGTYVDGVPVISCVLRGGDEVQIGRYLFTFDRLLEPTAPEGAAHTQ